MNFGEFVRTGQGSPDPIGTFRSFDAALTLGYSTKLSSDWGLGLNLRLIHSRLADSGAGSGAEQDQEGVATSVSFDVGAMWRPSSFEIPFVGDLSNRFSVGVNLANVGPKIYYMNQAQADPIPTNLRFGFAVRPFEDDYNSLTFTLDFQKLLIGVNKAAVGDSIPERDNFLAAIFTSWADEPLSTELRQVVTSMGFEYVYGQAQDFQFALRAGMFYEDPDYGNRKFVTMGAGIRYDTYGFDFSYITTDIFKGTENHPLSNTLRFTLLMGWGASPKTTLGFPRGI